MYTIRVDINDTLYDKVMLFFKNIPVKKLVVEKGDVKKIKKRDNIIDFFRSSPLSDDILLDRDKEIYSSRVVF